MQNYLAIDIIWKLLETTLKIDNCSIANSFLHKKWKYNAIFNNGFVYDFKKVFIKETNISTRNNVIKSNYL